MGGVVVGPPVLLVGGGLVGVVGLVEDEVVDLPAVLRVGFGVGLSAVFPWWWSWVALLVLWSVAFCSLYHLCCWALLGGLVRSVCSGLWASCGLCGLGFGRSFRLVVLVGVAAGGWVVVRLGLVVRGVDDEWFWLGFGWSGVGLVWLSCLGRGGGFASFVMILEPSIV